MRKPPVIAVAALTCLGVVTGCSGPATGSGGDTASHAASPSTRAEGGATSRAPAPPDHEPVRYTPSWTDRTVRTARGHLVNTCVPKALRNRATTLTTSDKVHLSALVLGSGPNGVLLDHEQGYNICSFIDIGKKLAAEGYHVVIPEYRNHGASQKSADNEHIDRDARAGLAELRRVGAERVFVGGASCGGTTAAVAGADTPLPVTGLLMMSSPARCGGVDAVAAVRKIKAPTLVVASPGDMNGNIEKDAREVYAASVAKNKKLVIDPSGYHGTDMIRRGGASGVKLRSRVVKFVAASFSRPR
ncbi:alpha/beta hydrolase [Streptomyces albus]|uniref:Alpha/beta fold hydrolase n=1 Tax=Streptomyces albus TaxID=1888 RepID=A0A6C1C0C9_9ACTN|nr:alpha/beta fold hydrolase [Streptomyces albus]QID35387.1 alpha/beta hydrolase [Streptomyces albus]TGG82280.1 alpha/beta fold hydrolase [Streptomyces albus]UVN57835.1 alpha/beta hydrolase [Streptomyces albus]